MQLGITRENHHLNKSDSIIILATLIFISRVHGRIPNFNLNNCFKDNAYFNNREEI